MTHLLPNVLLMLLLLLFCSRSPRRLCSLKRDVTDLMGTRTCEIYDLFHPVMPPLHNKWLRLASI
eukprot:jgi/Psemu1/301416/fgenesh1_kg.33_\